MRSGILKPICVSSGLLAGLLATAACQNSQPPAPDPSGAPTEFPWRSGPAVGATLVNLCAADAPPSREASLQVLLDASGSMGGYGAGRTFQPVYRWIAQAASAMESQSVRIVSRRAVIFSATHGLKEVDPNRLASTEIKGHTNLDRAVAASSESDIAVIFTDGVPNPGPTPDAMGQSDCTAGADYGCVVRRLAEFIEAHPDAGLWVVPLIGLYDGRLDLEGQTIPPGTTPEAVAANVKHTFSNINLAQTVVTLGPVPTYRGPRMALLLVLAKDASLGRSLIRHLMELSALSQVQRIGTATAEYRSGFGVMLPIEVLPGQVPRVTEVSAAQDKQTDSYWGPIATTSSPRPGGVDIRVSCQGSQHAWSRVALTFHRSAPTTASGVCSDMISLPSMALAVDADSSWKGDQSSLRRLIGGVQVASEGADVSASVLRGELLLLCQDSPPAGPDCSAPVPLVLSAVIDYRHASQALDVPVGGATSPDYLTTLSTDALATEPHKVLGLKSLLRGVLRRFSDRAASVSLASMTVCSTASAGSE